MIKSLDFPCERMRERVSGNGNEDCVWARYRRPEPKLLFPRTDIDRPEKTWEGCFKLINK